MRHDASRMREGGVRMPQASLASEGRQDDIKRHLAKINENAVEVYHCSPPL